MVRSKGIKFTSTKCLILLLVAGQYIMSNGADRRMKCPIIENNLQAQRLPCFRKYRRLTHHTQGPIPMEYASCNNLIFYYILIILVAFSIVLFSFLLCSLFFSSHYFTYFQFFRRSSTLVACLQYIYKSERKSKQHTSQCKFNAKKFTSTSISILLIVYQPNYIYIYIYI